jgi:Bacterial PH domain/Short C-terminal domain
MPFGFGKKKDDGDKGEKSVTTYDSIQPLDNDDYKEIDKIKEMLNPYENVLIVACQSRVLPGGSFVTPNIIYATTKRIILRDPYMLGIKENIIDIPYDVITSVKLEKGLFTSAIRFEAPALVGSKKLGMIKGIVKGENDIEGVIDAIPKRKAEDLLQVIRSGIHHRKDGEGYYWSDSSGGVRSVSSQLDSSSIADELTKLVKLREQGVLNEEEFARIKKDLLEGKR